MNVRFCFDIDDYITDVNIKYTKSYFSVVKFMELLRLVLATYAIFYTTVVSTGLVVLFFIISQIVIVRLEKMTTELSAGIDDATLYKLLYDKYMCHFDKYFKFALICNKLYNVCLSYDAYSMVVRVSVTLPDDTAYTMSFDSHEFSVSTVASDGDTYIEIGENSLFLCIPDVKQNYSYRLNEVSTDE